MPMGSVRRKFGTIILTLALTMGLGVGIVRFTTRAFTIKFIEVQSDSIQVILDQRRFSRNLLFFPADTIRKQVLSDNPWLADVQFQKKFPHTLRIKPILRTPAAILISGERRVLVDPTGIVLTDGDMGLALPHISALTQPFRVGQILTDERVLRALTLLTSVSDVLSIVFITDYENEYFLVQSDTLQIYLTHDKPMEELIGTLQTLMAGFRIKGTLPAVVDLRFDKPIIKF